VTNSGPYNPLDRGNLAVSVAEALLAKRLQQLGGFKPFTGAGIYAIYYVGTFPAYKAISQRNKSGKFEAPIYVGKAIPKGARKGVIDSSATTTRALYSRLQEHAESIQAVKSLDIKDFHCRYLVVDDIWIPLGESLLIAKFAPIWNTVIDGFGNHDPGKGRYAGMRPRWDVLHSGRNWADKCVSRPENAGQISKEVEEFLRSTPIPNNPRFYAEQPRVNYDPDGPN